MVGRRRSRSRSPRGESRYRVDERRSQQPRHPSEKPAKYSAPRLGSRSDSREKHRRDTYRREEFREPSRRRDSRRRDESREGRRDLSRDRRGAASRTRDSRCRSSDLSRARKDTRTASERGFIWKSKSPKRRATSEVREEALEGPNESSDATREPSNGDEAVNGPRERLQLTKADIKKLQWSLRNTKPDDSRRRKKKDRERDLTSSSGSETSSAFSTTWQNDVEVVCKLTAHGKRGRSDPSLRVPVGQLIREWIHEKLPDVSIIMDKDLSVDCNMVVQMKDEALDSESSPRKVITRNAEELLWASQQVQDRMRELTHTPFCVHVEPPGAVDSDPDVRKPSRSRTASSQRQLPAWAQKTAEV